MNAQRFALQARLRRSELCALDWSEIANLIAFE
jgi:hypothetical protein